MLSRVIPPNLELSRGRFTGVAMIWRRLLLRTYGVPGWQSSDVCFVLPAMKETSGHGIGKIVAAG